MKKILLTAATAFSLLAGTSAYAEVNLDVNIGVPVESAPVYVAPAPAVIVQQPGVVYDPRHDHKEHDRRYWMERRERERREHEEREHHGYDHR